MPGTVAYSCGLIQKGTPFFDPFWLLMSKKVTNVVIYLCLVFIYGRRHGVKSGVLLLFAGVILVGLTDQLTNLFKDGFMRLRPCYTAELDGNHAFGQSILWWEIWLLFWPFFKFFCISFFL